MATTRRVVVDTHAFLWWYHEDERRLSREARTTLARTDRIVVPDIVLWEIAMLAETDEIRLDRDVRTWLNEALADDRIVVQPITPEIAHASVSIGRWLQLDPADHLIAATAIVLGVPLITRDQELAKLPALEVIW